MTDEFKRDMMQTAEEEDSGILFIPDNGPSDADSDDDEREIFEKISRREAHEDSYVRPEMNIWQKIGEIWDRRKYGIIIAAVVLAAAAYLIISGLPEKTDADISVFVSSSDYPSSLSLGIAAELERYVDDTDGNGRHTVGVTECNLQYGDGVLIASRHEQLQNEMQGSPREMLWVVDKELFEMMVDTYGEDIFESFDGAPLWIEITCCEVLNNSVERGESPHMGLCLRKMTDVFRQDEELCRSYDNARLLLERLREAHPEMFR